MSNVLDLSAARTVKAARARADRIRSTAESLASLLHEAYELEDWKTLGYASWREYATQELSLSQSRAYQLLDLAKVITAVQAAAGGISTDVEITEAAARDLKPVLPEVAGEIRARVEEGEEPTEAVRAVVEQKRAERKAPAPEPEPEPNEEEHPEYGAAPEMDVHAELAAALEETQRLHAALEATDQGAELARWVEKYARLEGRVQQLLQTANEYRSQAGYQSRLLKQIRETLGVEKDREILPAIQARKVAP